MAVAVVVQSQLRVLVLAGEAPGVRLGAVALLRNDRAERRVVIVGFDFSKHLFMNQRIILSVFNLKC